MPELILASTSPYRRQLLKGLGIEFQCVAPDVDEAAYQAEEIAPQQLAETLAFAKADAVAKQYPEAIIIGGDQLVSLDGEILGKPGNRENAIAQLTRMQGRTHELITEVCLLNPSGKPHRIADITCLSMREMLAEEISRYVDYEQPFDCAGSYKIESAGISLFEKIETEDFTAITGLPLMKLSKELISLGINIPNH
ncbi:Maf family protein [Calycomorphotria hydatis]|uniref:7-methyl-GTP pyrophosphatase n=1 Tax=Calycomorphotria hydatis TaxID=2528027 RepID=A0A517T697_9PLAN|nr:nucleoside triphosphate pyrophosphatase [Calycomorphotria hydatis]QDT63894.1 Maf-like protein YceF [Calycomorphotria hydatis]